MKRKATSIFRLLLGAVGLGVAPLAAGAYTPVAVTGFNHDVIANGTGATATGSTSSDVDGAAYVFMAQDYNPTGTSFLPMSGVVNSAATAGLSFTLQPYTGSNALRVPAVGGSSVAGVGIGTLTFPTATPTSAGEIYALVTSGTAQSTVTVTVTFTDGTTQGFPGLTVADWYAGTTNIAIQGIGRVQRGVDNRENSATNPRLYQMRLNLLTANYAKNIQSITFDKTSAAGVLTVYGITVNPACAGTPTGGSAVASVSTACASTSIALSLSSASTTGVGVSYQWQSSTDNGVTWTNIAGATNAAYTATNQTVATQYRAQITCAASTQSAFSAPVSVAQSPFLNCYCVPVGNGTAQYINSVTLGGLSNVTNANSTSSYGDFTANSALTTVLNQGGSYPLTVGVRVNSTTAAVGVWIDYDHSGTFDTSEYLAVGTASGTGIDVVVSNTLVVPITALTGQTRMRVRSRSVAMTNANACLGTATTWLGETEDYLVSIVSASTCTGTPAVVTATASTAGICPNTSFLLSATGTAGQSGLSYQWQSSPAGANTFTNLGTAQTTPNYTVPSQAASTDYRLVVTCTTSSQSSTSNVVTVTQNTFVSCYCTPTLTCTNEWIRGVTVGALVNTGTTCSPNGFGDYTSATSPTATLTPGVSIPVTLDLHINATASQAGLWIDYDHSGTFDANEFVLVGTGPTTGFNNVNISLSSTLTVPLTAMSGVTRMRVMMRNGALTSAQACLTPATGEVEDYLVTIAPVTACAGTPTAGTATASVATVCPARPFTLTLSGYSGATTGLTFQWQSSPAGANTFTNITGATGTTYTVTSQAAATDYRAAVTCTASSQTAFSAPVAVALTSFLGCYCVPEYPGAGATNRIINVTLGTLTHNTSTLGNPVPHHHDYSSMQPGTLAIPDIIMGQRTNLVVQMGSDANQYSALWIDWNQNGVFNTTEFVTLGTNAGANGTATIPFTVPTTAVGGQTKLRIRGGEERPIGASWACYDNGSANGEGEDYLVNLVRPTATASGQAGVAITAFPNPASSVLTVQATGTTGAAQVQLLDLTGRVLQTAAAAHQAATFQLGGLAAGVYLVRYDDANFSKTIKVVKQ